MRFLCIATLAVLYEPSLQKKNYAVMRDLILCSPKAEPWTERQSLGERYSW